MQDAKNENVIKQYAAMVVALLMLTSIIAVYLFPWAIPIFWEMPENTVLPYYGILLAIEMAPVSFLVKAGLMEATKNNKKGE